MNHQAMPPDDSLESDAVWKLLDQAPAKTAGPRFVDDTVRAARLAGAPQSWWRRWLAPLPFTALAGAAAAVVFTAMALRPAVTPPGDVVTTEGSFAEIQEVAETEALIAATEHMDDFTDTELVSLIGF